MDKVVWGIIGCGDVAEVKSGPAFQKTTNSELLAVMRRDPEKAKNYALRHKVPHWYDNAEKLLQDSSINAVYIATPPSSHLEITLRAIAAGKNIYLEKPMALNRAEAEKISEALNKSNSKLTVAHYRRKLPAFQKVKDILEENLIGDVRFADVQILQSPKPDLVAETGENWRTDPEVSGGGYFHDLAPHQLDLMYHFFGDIKFAEGFSANQAGNYKADDLVNGMIAFKNGIQFRGIWCFNVAEADKKDSCTIYGSTGSVEFSFFGDRVSLRMGEKTEDIQFDPVPHVQQPMIEATVNYFLGNAINPCSAEEGLLIMGLMDSFCH